MKLRFFRHDHLLLILGLALTVCVYLPGLQGGFFFDDQPNIVDNMEVHVSSLDFRDWRAAALASPSTELRRPLAMLSFAANYYFTGLDPFPMKLTNLAIHLLNGVLLWKVLLALFRVWRIGRPPGLSEQTGRLIAGAVAGAWLLLPINLSSVLYVVQRMESLAQTFVLAGFWVYLAGRRLMLAGHHRSGLAVCATGIALGSALGLLSKESAVLLPVYTFLTECLLLRFEAPTRALKRQLMLLYGALLFVPAVAGLAWLLPHVMSAGAYTGRPFTLPERLLTETRVLVDYVGWTFMPDAGVLSFYHDDLPISHGWLEPPGTLLCAGLLAATLIAAIMVRESLPLLSLGIFWFFAAQLLTATVIPLELVFEHRNYCASIGLLLAAAALLNLLAQRSAFLALALPGLLAASLAFSTLQRALEWSHPLRLAYSEALKHPLSPRANYELGRTLTAASGYRPDSKLIEPAIEAFKRAAELPNAGAPPWAALIVVSGHMHRPIQPEWWTLLAARLDAQPLSAESISTLESLYECQHRGDCPLETQQLLSAFLAALNHPQPPGRLLAAYGAFAANQLQDYPLAERMLADALLELPAVNGIRFNLVKVLLLQKKFDQARQVLSELDQTLLRSADAEEVARLRRAVETGTARTGA